MKDWIVKLAVIGALLGGAAGIVACSDDDGDDMTLEEYFAAVDTVDNETTEAIDAAFESLPEDDPTVEQAQQAFDDFSAAINKAAADLEDINPPSEVEDKHEALLTALQGVADGADDVVAAGADATSVEDFFAAAESDAFVSANDAFTTACLDLQQFGDDNGITVDLGCDDDEEDQ